MENKSSVVLNPFNENVYINPINIKKEQIEPIINPTINTEKKKYNILDSAKSSISVFKSHLKVLYKLGKYDINQISINDLPEIINLLQKKYSPQYIKSILQTIKLHNKLDFKIKDFIKIKKSKNFFTTAKHDIIKNIINIAFSSIRSGNFRTETEIDTYIAIILVVCTSLRSSEIYQLTLSDLANILNSKPIMIRLKKQKTQPQIIIFLPILKTYYPFISLAIKEKYKLKSIPNNKLITVSSVSINNFIKTLYLQFDSEENISVGLKSIRVFLTTELISSNKLDLAQSINRHKSINTTLDYYNNPNIKQEI